MKQNGNYLTSPYWARKKLAEYLNFFKPSPQITFLLIFALSALFISSCADYSSPTPTDNATPTANVTAVPPTADTSWPTLVPSSADFDYYVLALSWAPDYCSAHPNDSQECAPGRKYAFVLHGLWPQYTSGYPSNCSSEPLPASVKAQFPNLYPNDKLFDHEWSKHGTCSGLSPTAYLTAAQQLKEHVQVPAAYSAPTSPFHTTADELKKTFVQADPTLTEAGLAVNCSGSGRYLTELYVCFSKEGQPAACGADVLKSALKSCANPDFIVRNVR